MTNFICNNRLKLSLIIIIAGFAFGYADSLIEKETSTIIQWILFFLVLIAVMYINFIHCVNDVEYPEEEAHPSMSDYQVPSLQDQQVAELTDGEHPFHSFDMPKEYKTNKQEDGNGGLDNPKEKIFYVVQPVHVTQEEFNDKIKPQIDMETKDNSKELPKALANPEIVIGYSLHNVHKKFRPMYNDICEFAINGNPKTEAEITAKLKPYGYTFTTERSNTNTIAFNLDSSPKIRIPEKGYFGIK